MHLPSDACLPPKHPARTCWGRWMAGVAALLAVGVWDSDFGDTPYDELDRRMTEWQQRFPELHLYTVATRADLDGYLAEHPDDAGLAVLSERDADQLADIVGPHSHPLREHADCSVLISR